MTEGEGSSEAGDEESKAAPSSDPADAPPPTLTDHTNEDDNILEDEHTIEHTKEGQLSGGSDSGSDEEHEEEDEDEDEEEEEPRLKYATLTRNLSALYRNKDATSSSLVAGDKMVCLCSQK